MQNVTSEQLRQKIIDIAKAASLLVAAHPHIPGLTAYHHGHEEAMRRALQAEQSERKP